jgi:hypothetical protein
MLVGMASLTHRERIVHALRLSSQPLDDDQLSERTGIRPGQTVNQACRALERDGILRRYEGPDRKIVNQLTTAPADPLPAGEPIADGGDVGSEQLLLSRAGGHAVPPGSSREQRDAERVMLDLLGAELGRSLEPATLTVPSGPGLRSTVRTPSAACWWSVGRTRATRRQRSGTRSSPTR